MEVSGVNNKSSSVVQSKGNIIDKNAFLKILTVELSNQDPLNSTDNTQYVSQMAQFTALEQTQNLNSSVEKLLLSEKMTQGTLLIGQNVEIQLDKENSIKDVARAVRVENNSVYIITDSGKFDIDQVIQVGDETVDK
ncbi:flagellar basal-body rod modification protein FlgD [Fonticella tunisiensis]|uniref:Flagellar basal-body rod modification protein FlgD n=1 Tax=Fonticella tunisiensis TaxID=1096341 RepID=A0A4R7KBX1_9CLOT|nr:flagellar hook capping FlgD N-terminal domain-containing protein [Fonticella tunisiensis]TDT50606.1 flagellar basal-body rod modification protein FlgD [Fonticella tunisiensis]